MTDNLCRNRNLADSFVPCDYLLLIKSYHKLSIYFFSVANLCIESTYLMIYFDNFLISLHHN